MKAILAFLAIFALAFVAYLLISTDRNTDLDPVDASFTTKTAGGDTFAVVYVSGDLLNTSRISILFEIDGERFRVAGDEAGIGDTWTAGESVCGVGPDCIRPSGQRVSVQVSYDGGILYQSKERVLR